MRRNTVAEHKVAELELRSAVDPLSVKHCTELERHPVLEILVLLAKEKSFILKSVFAVALVAIVISLLLPDTYTGKAKFLSPQLTQSMPVAAIEQLALPQISQVGQNEVYLAMLRSETVANRLIDRFALMQVYGADLKVDARRTLAERTEISEGKDGVIPIAVNDRDPQRAADLANGYLEELETLAKTLAETKAAERTRFLKHQVKIAGEELTIAEQALKQTQEKTGLVLFDPQTTAMIQAMAAMHAQIVAQEIRLQSMRAFATPANPALVREEQQLTALRGQEAKLQSGSREGSILDVPLESVPTGSLEYGRRLREVKYRETLFELLGKECEAARIDEVQFALNVRQVVKPLDRAVRPERRSAPHRFLIVLSATLLSLPLAAFAVFLRKKLERTPEDEQLSLQPQIFSWYLHDGQENIRKPALGIKIAQINGTKAGDTDEKTKRVS